MLWLWKQLPETDLQKFGDEILQKYGVVLGGGCVC